MNTNAFTVSLAGVAIEILPLHGYIYRYCQDYLTDEPPAFTLAATQADIDYERSCSEAEDRLEGLPIREFSDSYLETLAVYRKIAEALCSRDILLFHGSCIAVDGTAYLFTAKSGTGKSTHAALWARAFGDRCQAVNDDKPLLRVTPEGVIACGTPWNGKHRRGSNITCPLKAICILERSERNHIEKISAKEGYALLLQQTYRPKDPGGLARTLTVLDKLLSRVALYRLGCNMDPEAALVSYRGMNGEG